MIHSARLIPTDGAVRTSARSSAAGTATARGHWEGNTLVVETTNFNRRTRFRNSTRGGEGDRALHARRRRHDRLSVHRGDPNTWTRPWTAAVPMRKVPGPIYEYACHEGNYGLPNILRAQRVEDAKAAKGVTD